MRCPLCQAENREGRRFCAECGAPLALACPACGFSNEPGEKFCGGCGQPLSSAPQAVAGFPSPQACIPRHLAEKILTSRSALEGERKQVTVLFADLKGSMELLADRDPEEARKLLDPVLERMMEAVHRYEGTVNQVMGDGIMALFGAPIAHEDHAVRACYAALRMQESVSRYGDELQRAGGVPVQIRVGLNSGEVVVRSIGSDLHMDYTAVGQTTHRAARMEQIAKAGSVLLTGETLKLAEGYVQVKPLGAVPVKGLEAPTEVYELVGVGMARSRLQAAAVRGLTRFVGREAELEALRQALEKARAGRGQVVALVGEPGVGKSRLVWEFTHSHRTQGWLILESGSVSYGKATPYLPLVDLLKAYFQLEARDDDRKIREKVTGKLLTLDRALEPILLALLALLDVPIEDPQWQALDPPQRRQQTREAVKRLLLGESRIQPLLLILEDLHWIDSETQALLDSLIESLPTVPMLLLVNYRPEYQHGWGSKTYYSQLRIDPLPPESANELLQALLGKDLGLEPLKQLLIERTEGNPFFLEEGVRTLIETQVLVGDRGVYRLAKALKSIQVPATVQAILAARIDRLLPEQKELLQSASVVGKDVPFTLLHAIAELPEEELRRGLAHLQATEFLYEASLFPEIEYTFKHALTHEVAYQSLLHERRRALHARITEAIERLYPGHLTDQVERLAQHALRGEVWDKALIYLQQAGTKVAARGAYREALRHFEQALEALKHLPESRGVLERAVDLRLDLRNTLLAVGEFERVLDYLREAETIAQTLGDQRRLGRVSLFVTNYFFSTGDLDRALESGQRDLALAVTLGDLGLQVVANYYLGQVYYARGAYRRAIDFLNGTVATLQGDLVRERFGQGSHPSVSARSWLVRCLAELGEFTEAITRGEEAVRIAEMVGHPGSRIPAYLGMGLLELRRGNVHRAITVLEHGLELCRVADLPVAFPMFASFLAHAYALAGRHAEVLPLAKQAAEQITATRILAIYTAHAPSLGEAYLLAHRVGEAMELAQRALDLSRAHKERGHEAWALRLLGEIAAHGDAPELEKADGYYRDTIALAEELGMRPLVARCHLGLGRLHRRAGKRQQAEEHLTTARTMLRDMDLGFWLKQAEAELETLG